MHKIHLLGELSRFGEVWESSETKLASVFKLIECQRDDFKPFIIKAVEAGCDLAIVSGSGLEIEEPLDIFMDNVVQEDFYVSLVPAGSGKGFGKILAGIFIALITYIAGPVGGIIGEAATNIGYAIAVNLALQGVTQLLTKVPSKEKEEDGPGLFNGPINTVKSGQPVPILYGELLVGGTPIHVNIGANQGIRWNIPTDLIADPSGASSTFIGSPFTVAATGTTEGSGDVNPVIQSNDYHVILQEWILGSIDLGTIGINI